MVEGFQFNNPEQYTLSIRLSTDGFSFSAYNLTEEDSFHYLPYSIDRSRSMAANVKTMLEQNDFLKLPYKQIRIYSTQANYIPVPADLFDEDQATTLYHYNFAGKETDNHLILHNRLPKANIAMLYAMEKTVHQQLSREFPEAKFYTIAAPLTEYFAIKSHWGNNKKLYAYRLQKTMAVFGFDNGKLLLLNTFPCRHDSDAIYYLLYIWQQLDLDRHRDELHLSGEMADKETFVGELREYLRHVYVINPMAEFHRAEYAQSGNVPFDLQTSYLCDI